MSNRTERGCREEDNKKKTHTAKRGDAKANAVINLFYSKWGFACGYNTSTQQGTAKCEEEEEKDERRMVVPQFDCCEIRDRMQAFML